MYTMRTDILAYYEQGKEDARLRDGPGLLEFLRTRDVLRRLLPPAPATVLDVGGGSGVHAAWLAGDGHRVEVIDPVPLHVAQAAERLGVTARLGDARELPVPDGAADIVLLLGPLYHLPERPDRLRALTEARRAVRPGGLVVAATINRFAGLHDTMRAGRYFDPAVGPRVDAAGRDGRHDPTGGMFTTAYFHDPAEVPQEFRDAGLTPTGQYGLEGAAWLMDGLAEWLADDERREAVLTAMRRTESVPSLLGVSGHLLTAGTAGTAGTAPGPAAP
jgi:SAM-dependent methyltransferase